MRASRPKFFKIQARDIKVFKYLLATKGASIKQIHIDLFSDVSERMAYKRIKKMYDYRLLGRKAALSDRACFVYFLESKVFKKGILDPDYQTSSLQTDAIDHDLALVDIRRCFLKSKGLVNYFTENEVKVGCADGFNYPVNKLRLLRSDGFLAVNLDNFEYHFAIEYERSVKTQKRYKSLFKGYYASDDIHNVIYLAKNKRIKKLIFKCDQELMKEKRINLSKILVVNLQDIKKPMKSWKLTSSTNHSFDFQFIEPQYPNYLGS